MCYNAYIYSGKQFGHAGEDAYFVHQDDENRMHMLGVADGVYEWTIQGIDPGIYSRGLIEAAYNTCHADVLNENALHVLEQAYIEVSEQVGVARSPFLNAVPISHIMLICGRVSKAALQLLFAPLTCATWSWSSPIWYALVVWNII